MGDRYKDRKTLKSYFQKGDTPTEEQFSELIDSVPNIHDDGQVKTSALSGSCLFPSDATGIVATVFAEDPENAGAVPRWRIALGGDGSLEIHDGKGEAVMTIDRDKNVTVNGTLKAGKYLSAKGGDEPPGADILKISADGLWHNLPVESKAGRESKGCRVYHLTACYLNLRSGTYSACEALASHSNGSRRRIRSPQRHWWGWSGNVKVRWRHKDGQLYLQMKSLVVHSGSEIIRCSVETRWNL